MYLYNGTLEVFSTARHLSAGYSEVLALLDIHVLVHQKFKALLEHMTFLALLHNFLLFI